MPKAVDHRIEGAGKGDGNRVQDTAAYRAHYDSIFRKHRAKKLTPGVYVVRGGKFQPAQTGDEGLLQRDNSSIRCPPTGVAPDQAAQANQAFGHLGVKFDPASGDAVYKDRRSRIRVNKLRGFYDRNEIRG